MNDAINLSLHYILQHLDQLTSYVRALFVNYSSAFNTILPDCLHTKLLQLQVPRPICEWITDFLTNRKKQARVGSHLSAPLTTNTGSLQDCVLSPYLFSLYTNDCTSSYSIKLVKFADDISVLGLIKDNDESVYRNTVSQLEAWCTRNNLELNIDKTVLLIMVFHRHSPLHLPLLINTTPVQMVDSVKFLGTTITSDLKWETHSSKVIKWVNQRMFFLSFLPEAVWYPASSAHTKNRLERFMRTASRLTGLEQEPVRVLHDGRSRQRARGIVGDPLHPAHSLFTTLPSGRRFRSIKTKTTRHLNRFFPQDITLLNKPSYPFVYNIYSCHLVYISGHIILYIFHLNCIYIFIKSITFFYLSRYVNFYLMFCCAVTSGQIPVYVVQ